MLLKQTSPEMPELLRKLKQLDQTTLDLRSLSFRKLLMMTLSRRQQKPESASTFGDSLFIAVDFSQDDKPDSNDGSYTFPDDEDAEPPAIDDAPIAKSAPLQAAMPLARSHSAYVRQCLANLNQEVS